MRKDKCENVGLGVPYRENLNKENNVVGYHDLIGIRHAIESGADLVGAERLARVLLAEILTQAGRRQRLGARFAE